MLFASRYDIYSGGIDAAVPEYIGELCNIFFNSVKSAGKKVSEVVGKYFARVDVCILAKLLHFSPYIRAADWFTYFCDEYRSAIDMMTIHIFQ